MPPFSDELTRYPDNQYYKVFLSRYYDALFDEDVTYRVLGRMNLKDNTEENFDDSKELDEFLRGFKIVDRVSTA